MTTTTSVDVIAENIYRVSSPVQIPGGGFSFNQHLVLDAATDPQILACMHGSAWRGPGAILLKDLGTALEA